MSSPGMSMEFEAVRIADTGQRLNLPSQVASALPAWIAATNLKGHSSVGLLELLDAKSEEGSADDRQARFEYAVGANVPGSVALLAENAMNEDQRRAFYSAIVNHLQIPNINFSMQFTNSLPSYLNAAVVGALCCLQADLNLTDGERSEYAKLVDVAVYCLNESVASNSDSEISLTDRVGQLIGEVTKNFDGEAKVAARRLEFDVQGAIGRGESIYQTNQFLIQDYFETHEECEVPTQSLKAAIAKAVVPRTDEAFKAWESPVQALADAGKDRQILLQGSFSSAFTGPQISAGRQFLLDACNEVVVPQARELMVFGPLTYFRAGDSFFRQHNTYNSTAIEEKLIRFLDSRESKAPGSLLGMFNFRGMPTPEMKAEIAFLEGLQDVCRRTPSVRVVREADIQEELAKISAIANDSQAKQFILMPSFSALFEDGTSPLRNLGNQILIGSCTYTTATEAGRVSLSTQIVAEGVQMAVNISKISNVGSVVGIPVTSSLLDQVLAFRGTPIVDSTLLPKFPRTLMVGEELSTPGSLLDYAADFFFVARHK